MSFFKKKSSSSSIPLPPSETPASQPQPSQSARSQLLGGGSSSDPYARNSSSPAPSYASRDPYATSNKPAPANRGPESDPTRAALFAGYNPGAVTREPGRRQYEDRDGNQAQEGGQLQDEDEDVESIKRDIRGVKQESLGSTRNALRIAREAEETARGTITKLADQSERIASTERHLDLAKAASSRADDKTTELRKLNRSIFVPVGPTFNKEGKRMAEERRITDRHIQESEERAQARVDVQATQRRLGDRQLNQMGGRQPTAGALAARKEERKKYQFEATASDDELEDELDDNLDETLDVTRRLKQLAMAAGEEIKGHNERLIRVTEKAEGLDLKIMTNVERLKRIN